MSKRQSSQTNKAGMLLEIKYDGQRVVRYTGEIYRCVINQCYLVTGAGLWVWRLGQRQLLVKLLTSLVIGHKQSSH